ncbi:hypothetical protein H920_12705 [Fukomys damarensis]|uniref:Uncharacterized protein n=1 Tax=Fukomys damarensis TaxID=885580 RepID=A0A091DSX1_FUKDA|nr:hypothetical protein H920_12705 [Fukomys damarensis]
MFRAALNSYKGQREDESEVNTETEVGVTQTPIKEKPSISRRMGWQAIDMGRTSPLKAPKELLYQQLGFGLWLLEMKE